MTATGYNAEVAVYKGDDLLCMGTIRECAKKLGVRPDTITFYMTPTYRKRVARRKKSSGNIREVVRV